MTSTAGTAHQQAQHVVTGMTSEEIDSLAWQPIPGCPGVHVKQLWQAGHLADALLRYEADASTPGQPHPDAHHHIWVLSGEASIGGRRLGAGSYAHVPPGSPHPIRSIGPWGCLLLQTHVPDMPAAA